jgi:malate-CoA ligase subunit alpha
VEILRDAGVTIVPTPATFGQTVAGVLAQQRKAA